MQVSIINLKEDFQQQKPYDEIQYVEDYKGYPFLATAGHGYLAVNKLDKFAKIAKKVCSYGYEGKYAFYLEEDCEVSEFLALIN